MDFHVWLAFFIAAWAIAVSPGSGAVLSMSHGLAWGVRRTTPTILGLQAGLVMVLLIAGGGVGAILLASEQAFWAVKLVGALYLIYLGALQWHAAPSAAVQEAGQAPLSLRRRFVTGFLTNVTNPKGIVFMVAVLPQFLDPARSLTVQLAILAVTMVGVDLVVMHGYAFLASRLQGLFRSARALRWQNRLFGGVLMAVGTALLFVKRQTQIA